MSTEADVRRRFADARALGCNFLRLSHYPHHEHVARIADELGFMLWEEIPVYWAIGFDDPRRWPMRATSCRSSSVATATAPR